MDWGAVLGLALVAGVGAALVRRAARSAGPAELDAFARVHGLALTDANRPVVARHVRRGRLFRTLGGTIGALVVTAYNAAARPEESFGLDALGIVVGYLLGASLAAGVILRPAGGPRSALVSPRALTDYLPRRLLVGLRALPLVSILCAAASVAVEPPALRSYSLTLAVAGVVVGIVAELLLAAVVRRRQPVVSADLLAADNATRASSLYALVAAATAGQCLLLSGQFVGLVELAGGETRPPGMVGIAGALALQLAGIVAWIVIRHPRPQQAREPAP